MASVDWPALQLALQNWVQAGTGLPDAQVYWTSGRPRPTNLPHVVMSIPQFDSIVDDWIEERRKVLVIPNDVVESVNVATDELVLTAHAYLTGDGPVRFTTTGTLPAPLAVATDYWLVKTGANAVRVARSFADAIAAVPVVIDLTSAGTGAHTIVTTSQTVRAGQEMRTTARGMRELLLELQCFATPATGIGHARALLGELVARAALPSMVAQLEAVNVALIDVGSVMSTDPIVHTAIFEPRAVLEIRLRTDSVLVEDGTIIQSTRLHNLISGQSQDVGP